MCKIRIVALLLPACMLFTACGPIGGTDHDVSTSKLEPELQACDKHAASYQSARDNFCVGLAENHNFEAHERQVLAALAQLFEGDYDRAMDQLAQLIEAGHTGDFQSQLVEGLSTLYLDRFRWPELHDLLSRHGHEAQEDDELELKTALAAAFRDLPPEEYAFDFEPAKVRTSVNRFGQPSLETHANGVKKKFVLDTGAGITVLTKSAADQIGARTWSQYSGSAQTSTTNRVEVWPGMIDELRLGSLTIRNHPIGVIDDEALEFKLAGVPILKIDGIIGWPLLRRLRVEIAYDGGHTTIRPSVKQPQTRRNLFWLGYPIVVACGDDGEPYFFGLDTGAAGTSLNTHVLEKADAVVRSGGQGVRLGAGGSETVQRRRVLDFSMHLAGRRYRFPKLSITDGVKGAEFIKPDGRLGSDVLQDARVVVDLPNGYFAIER